MRRPTFALIGLLLGSSAPAHALFWPSAVQRTERDLHADEVDVRRRAAQALRELPRGSGTRLARSALSDSDLDVRLTALDACLSFAVPGLGELLVPWLTDADRRLRLAAAQALAESPSSHAVLPLGRALGDTDASVRSAAASALGESAAPEAVLALLGHLDDGAPEVRRDVARALGELGDARAVVPLIGKVQDTRPIVRESVARALGQLEDARAVSALLLSLHDADETVRVAALDALGRIADPSAVPSLSGLLHESSARERSAAVDALARIHTQPALKALVAELATDGSGRPRSEIVTALGRVGLEASLLLRTCLSAGTDPERVDGCALALAEAHDISALPALREALGRGALHPLAALQAFTELGAPEALPAVLEYLSDGDVLVRRAALLAAKRLLDPRHPDGRAVEPIARALFVSRHLRAEQADLVDLLGQTGSARALGALLPLAAPGDDVALRGRALSALGFLAESGQVPTLLAALDDESGSVRLSAAVALGRLRLDGHGAELLSRLAHSREDELNLLSLALGGLVSHAHDPALVAGLGQLLAAARGAERDTFLELLGRVPSPAAVLLFSRAVDSTGLAADRAKFAEALAAHPDEHARLAGLLSDVSPRVRENAAWSLGEVAVPAEQAALERALADLDANVEANALQSLARLAARTHGRIATVACSKLRDSRALLRAVALRALRFTGERCEHAEELTALARDRAEFVRLSAVALVRDVPRGKADTEALMHARDRDPSSALSAELAARPSAPPEGVDPTIIVVLAAGQDLPQPAEPFALLRADGLVRLGVSDRRGQVFEFAAPHGPLSLVESAWAGE